MNSALRTKLATMQERHAEVTALLCDADVAADTRRRNELAREHAELAPVVAQWEALLRLEGELEATRELVSDPDMRELAAGDLGRLQSEHEAASAQLQALLTPRDPHDARSVVLEIRAGTGGEEAALFAADLWRMYARHAERKGWKVEVASMSEAAAGGIKELMATISGREVFGHLKHESGVHRVQRVPATEAQGRIHTSTATVAVMPEAQDVDVHLDPTDLRIDVMRSSGAGGQHVNTTDSAVRVTHIPTGLAVMCQQERSQTKNRELAMALLRSRLLDAELRRAAAERAAARKEQVGTGERAEKVRTYNFPQDRVTDHRVNHTRHDLSGFLDGDIDDLVGILRAHERAAAMAARDEVPSA